MKLVRQLFLVFLRVSGISKRKNLTAQCTLNLVLSADVTWLSEFQSCWFQTNNFNEIYYKPKTQILRHSNIKCSIRVVKTDNNKRMKWLQCNDANSASFHIWWLDIKQLIFFRLLVSMTNWQYMKQAGTGRLQLELSTFLMSR